MAGYLEAYAAKFDLPVRTGARVDSLSRKDGRYVVPLKDWVRQAEGLQLGDIVEVRLTVDV